jgi:hypothetical protein
LIPARAGLNAVADPRRRNIQTGTAILKFNFFEVPIFMLKNFLFVLICFTSAANLACSTTDTATSTNANVGNVVNLDPANLPPGFSTSPVPVNGNIPGITNPNDANANKIPAGNIPGIPDPNKKTPQPKNTPPIPAFRAKRK